MALTGHHTTRLVMNPSRYGILCNRTSFSFRDAASQARLTMAIETRVRFDPTLNQRIYTIVGVPLSSRLSDRPTSAQMTEERARCDPRSAQATVLCPSRSLDQIVLAKKGPIGYHGSVVITIRTSKSFEVLALSLLGKEAYDDFIEFLARNYLKGDIIPGTDGVRKLRYARQGRGKSGGFRVIYYYYADNRLIVPFTMFAKNEKANLSQAEKNELSSIVQEIKKEFRK